METAFKEATKYKEFNELYEVVTVAEIVTSRNEGFDRWRIEVHKVYKGAHKGQYIAYGWNYYDILAQPAFPRTESGNVTYLGKNAEEARVLTRAHIPSIYGDSPEEVLDRALSWLATGSF